MGVRGLKESYRGKSERGTKGASLQRNKKPLACSQGGQFELNGFALSKHRKDGAYPNVNNMGAGERFLAKANDRPNRLLQLACRPV